MAKIIVLSIALFCFDAGAQTVTNGGGTQNTVMTSTNNNTPSMFIGGPASGPCTGASGGATFAIAGLGVGGNGAVVDTGCALRELARVAMLVGRDDIANRAIERAAADLGIVALSNFERSTDKYAAAVALLRASEKLSAAVIESSTTAEGAVIVAQFREAIKRARESLIAGQE